LLLFLSSVPDIDRWEEWKKKSNFFNHIWFKDDHRRTLVDHIEDENKDHSSQVLIWQEFFELPENEIIKLERWNYSEENFSKSCFVFIENLFFFVKDQYYSNATYQKTTSKKEIFKSHQGSLFWLMLFRWGWFMKNDTSLGTLKIYWLQNFTEFKGTRRLKETKAPKKPTRSEIYGFVWKTWNIDTDFLERTC